MNSFEALVDTLTEELSSLPAFSRCVIGPEFPVAERASLDVPELRIGIYKAAVQPCDPGNFLGYIKGSPVHGKRLTLTLRFTLFCSRRDGGAPLRELAGELLSFLPFNSTLKFSSAECGELQSDPDTGGVKMTVFAQLDAVLKA